MYDAQDNWHRGRLSLYSGRQRLSNQNVMDHYFDLLEQTLKTHNLPADHICNCDETGWNWKEKSKTNVIVVTGRHNYQQTVSSKGHITSHLCIILYICSLLIFFTILLSAIFSESSVCIHSNVYKNFALWSQIFFSYFIFCIV